MSNETLPDLLPDVHVNNLTAINVNISGTLTSNTFISISQIETDDTLIKLANNNTDDIMDVGWYAKYISAGTKYRGNVFDVSAGRFIFFTTNTEPTTTVSSISYSDVQLKDLYAVNLTGTLTTTSQPNITSVGTLTGLTLAGNLDMNGFNLLNLGSFVIDQLDATITRAAQPNITSVGTLTGLTLAGNLDMGGFNLLNLGSFSVDQLDATITRAAQPNITSVGTLLGLSVNGVLNMSTNNITNIATLTAANLGGTLTTAAQSNITSVGTLTGLTMAGNLNMGTHDITNIATVTATNIGGTLTTATQSNITSVGTLTGLTMAGNLNMGTHDITNVATVTATNLGGTLTTAAQSNITSVGSLSGLTMAGNLNMNTHDIVNATTVTATNISGTLTTASQSNITSVGILLGLTVTGTSLFDNGTDVVPSIAFTSDTNTGLYKIGADQIGITTNGTLNFSFGSSQNETKQIILFPNGSVSAPTFAFSVSNTTGIYSSGSNVIDFTTGSAQRLSLSSTVMTVTNDDISGNQFQIIGRTLATKKIMLGYNTTSNFGKIEVTASTPLHIEASSLNPNTTNTIGLGTASLKWSDSYINKIYIADGSAVAPGLTFSSDTNTGLYSSAADQLSVSIGGTHAYTFGAVNISANQIQAPVGSTGSASYAFAGDPNTGIFSSTADTINFTAGGIDALQISTSAISTSLPFTFNGNLFANAYYFTGDPDTSITNPADDNNIIFTTGGGTRFVIGSADITSNLKFLLPNGSIGSPSLAFATGSNTGFYYDNAIPYLGLQFAGIDLMYFDASRVDIIASLNVITGICAAPQFLFYAEPTTGFVNPTTDTLAFMTNSINRLTINTAVITTTLPIVGPNGAATAPSYSFSGDPNTGMYSGGADVLAFSTGGTSRLQITTANLTSTIPIIVPVGSAVAPSYSFSGDPNTGVFSSAADTIDFSTGGTSRMQITTTGVIFDVAVTFNSGFAIGAGSAAVPAYAFSTDPNTGMYSGGADVLAFSTGGVLRMQIDTANLTSVLPIIAPVGSAAAPSYSFSGDLDTGVYSAGANTLNFSTGGTSRMQISTTAITSTLPVTVPDGNTAAPGIRFTSEATGFSVPAAGTLAFSIAGSSQVNITTARVATSIPILGQNGSTSAPVYSFTNSTNTGIYLDSVGILGISAGGVSSTIFSATQALFLAGSVGSPGLSFASDTNTGIYSAGADAIAVTTGGTARFVLNTATADLTLPLRLTGNSKYTTINTTDNTFKDTNAGSVINQSLQIADYVGTGYGFVGMNFDALDTNSSLNFNLLNASSQIIRGAAVVGNVSTVRTAGSETGNLYFYIKPSASAIAEVLRMVASGSNLQMQSVNGTASVPSYSFVNSTGSGLYYTGTTNTIAIATGGTARLTLNTTSVTSSLPFYAPDGTAAAPSHTFTNDTDTGIYSYGVNSIGISAGGTWRQVVDSNGIYGSVPFLGVSGSVSAPAFTFVSDTNTGIYSSAADTLDFTTGGTNRLSLSTTTATSTIKHSITNSETATNSLYLNNTDVAYTGSALYTNFVRAATASYNVLNAVANSVQIATLSGLGYWFVSDGTSSAPSYSFVSDPNTGMFSSGADSLAFSTGGTTRLTISTTAITSVLPINTGLGSATAPSYSFNGDPNTGMFSSGADVLDFSTGGVSRVQITTSEIIFAVAATFNAGFAIAAGSAATPAYSFSGDLDTGMYSAGANTLNFSTGGTSRVQLDTTNLTLAVAQLNPAGTALLPAYSFSGDANTGMFSSGADVLDFSTGGTSRMQITTTGVIFNVAATFNSGFAIGAGTAGTPAYSFLTDPNTGMYSGGADVLAFSTGGVLRMQIDTANLTSVLPINTGLGSATTPSYSFTGDTNTGMFSSGADTIDFSAGGTTRVQITTTEIIFSVAATFNSGFALAAGSAAAPAYAFSGDLNTGMYSSAADTINFSTGGVSRVQLDGTNLTTTLPIIVPLGSASLPAYTFSGDPNTGMYSSASDTLNFSTGGTSRVQLNTTNLTLTVAQLNPAGTVSLPSYSFSGDANTGLFSSAADTIDFSAGGTTCLQLSPSGATFSVAVTFNSEFALAAGSAAAPSYSFSTDPNTGMYSASADVLAFSTGGTLCVQLDTTNLTTTLPIIGPLGSAALPTYTFSGDVNTGLYSAGADILAFSTGGVSRVQLNTTNLTSTLAQLNPLGTDLLPSYSFSGDANTGMYSSAADTLNFSTGGTSRMQITTTGVSFDVAVTFNSGFAIGVGSAALPSYSFSGDPNTGMYSSAADTVDFSTGGVNRLSLSTTNLTSTLAIIAPLGSAATPAYSFSGDSNTGMFSSGADVLDLSTGGTSRIQLSTTNLTSTVAQLNPLGTAALPAYSFSGDSNTGMYSAGADTLNFSTGGTLRLSLLTTAIVSVLPVTVPDGSTAAPGIRFTSEVTGLSVPSAGTLAITTAGNSNVNFTTARIATSIPILGQNGTTSAPVYSFTNSTNTGTYLDSVGVLGISAGGTSSATFSATQALFLAGSAGTPSISFIGDPDTGFYNSTTNTIAVTTGGTARLTINTATGDLVLPLRVTGSSKYITVNTTDNTFKDTTIGSAINQSLQIADYAGTGYGSIGTNFNTTDTNSSLNFNLLNASSQIIRGAAVVGNVSTVRTAGSETGNLYFYIKPSASAAAEILRMVTSGSDLQMQSANGTATLPIYSFVNSTGSGLYYTGTTNTIALATGGTARLTLNTTSMTSSLPYYAPDGTAAAPSYTFTSDTNTGFYSSAADQLGVSAGGTQKAYFDTNGMSVVVGTASLPSLNFIGDTNTGIYSAGADQIGLTTGGSAKLRVDTTSIYADVAVQSLVSTASAPGYCFQGFTTSGMYITSGLIGLSQSGNAKITLNHSDVLTDSGVSIANTLANSKSLNVTASHASYVGQMVTLTSTRAANSAFNALLYTANSVDVVKLTGDGRWLSGDGSATTPSYSFMNSTGSGLYYTGTTNTIALATNGTARVTINTATIAMDSIPLSVTQTGTTTALTVSNNTGVATGSAPLIVNNTSSTSGARTSSFLTANTANDAGQGGLVGFGKADSSRQMAFLSFYPSVTAGVEKIGISIHTFGDVVQFNGVGQTLGYNTSMSATVPTYSFIGDSNTGLYSSAADTLDFTTGGTNRLSLSTTTATSTIKHSITNAETATNSLYLNSSNASYASTALYANFVRAATASYNVLNAVANSVTIATLSGLGYWFVSDGTAAAPSYSFVNDPNTGMFSSAADTIGFATGGTSRLTLSTTALTSTLPVVIPVGSAASPSMTFASDLNNGIYSSATDNVDVATAGVRRLNVDSAGNVAIGASPSFGSGAVVLFLANATTAPTANPTGGGILYVESGALKFRGSSGTITTIAQA